MLAGHVFPALAGEDGDDDRQAPHRALDCQFISDPTYNRAHGPVLVLWATMHWSF
jgi:hypothetical protein